MTKRRDGNPAEAKTTWDGGVASTYKVLVALTPKPCSIDPWRSIVVTHNPVGGVDSSYFAS